MRNCRLVCRTQFPPARPQRKGGRLDTELVSALGGTVTKGDVIRIHPTQIDYPDFCVLSIHPVCLCRGGQSDLIRNPTGMWETVLGCNWPEAGRH